MNNNTNHSIDTVKETAHRSRDYESVRTHDNQLISLGT